MYLAYLEINPDADDEILSAAATPFEYAQSSQVPIFQAQFPPASLPSSSPLPSPTVEAFGHIFSTEPILSLHLALGLCLRRAVRVNRIMLDFEKSFDLQAVLSYWSS